MSDISGHLQVVRVLEAPWPRATDEGAGRHLRLFNALATAIQRATTPDRLLETLLAVLGDDGLQACVLYLNSERNELLLASRPADAWDTPDVALSLPQFGTVTGIPLSLDEVPQLRAVVRRRSALYAKRFADLVESRHPAPDQAATSALVDRYGPTSAIFAPLVTRGDVLGLLGVLADDLHPADCPWVQVLANQVALALANALLQLELREREQQVSRLLKATIDAQEEERERICLDIHDGVAQTLAPAFHYLQAMQRHAELSEPSRTHARKAEALVRDAIREAREVIASLRPAALDTLGLVQTLRYEMDELEGRTALWIVFEADEVRFPKAVETAVYRIVHEAVNNAVKHAHASQIAIRVRQEQADMVVEVQDDGVGFDVNRLERGVGVRSSARGSAPGLRTRTGVGLLSMRKRAELLDGTFELASTPGQGTRVRVVVPLFRADDDT